MENKVFKVGDKVAVYGYRTRADGKPFGCVMDRWRGDVQFVNSDTLEVKIEGCLFIVHPKQCRRLKPKKRREWKGGWNRAGAVSPDCMVFIPNGVVGHTHGVKVRECMRIREVRIELEEV